MKKITNNHVIARIIAVLLAGIMSMSAGGQTETLIVEEHELPVAMVDGKYDGDDSDLPYGGEGDYDEETKKRSINILEIVGDYRMAMLGFLIDGCEPIGKGDMDAIVNKYPGSEVPQYEVKFRSCKEFNVYNIQDMSIYDLAMNTGSHHSMYYYPKTMNGYYECVDPGKGSYALKEKPSGNNIQTVDGKVYVKNAVMVSKYANNKARAYTGYDYIWVEDTSMPAFGNEAYMTLLSDIKTNPQKGDKIYVYDHYKNKYVNNELFLCMMSNLVSNDMNINKGAYDGGTGGSTGGKYSDPNSIKENDNYAKIEEWRKNNTVTVTTKEASQVSREDVDKADLIFIINGESDGSYKTVFGINCYATGDYNAKHSFSTSNDISVEVMKRIFKHVVVDEDVALAYSHMNCTGTWELDTNIKKLGFMLSYVKSNKKLSEGDGGVGTGRDFFRNLFENYGRKTGKEEIDINDGIDIFTNGSDTKKTTDFIKIDDSGNLCFDGKVYSKWGAADWQFQNEWLYKDFLKNHYGINGKLTYYIDGGDIADKAKYRNQMIFKESYNMFSSDGGAKSLFSIMKNAKLTEHIADDDVTTKKKSYYFTMNIINGDSVTPETVVSPGEALYNRNKALYINKYELSHLTKIPINIEIVTSHPVTSVTISKTKRSGEVLEPISQYTATPGVLEGDSDGEVELGGLVMMDETEYDGVSHKPKDYIEAKDYYKYKLTGTIDVDTTGFGPNNTITVTAQNSIGRSISDMITVVVRDFFSLN